MDILLTIFIFIVGFVISLVGLIRQNSGTTQSYVFLAMGAFIFIFLSILIFTDPIQVVSGFDTYQNVDSSNNTITNTTFSYTNLEPYTNSGLGFVMIGIGLFLLLFVALMVVGGGHE